MTDLQNLLDRVRAATGPDRGLDYSVAFATKFRPTNRLKESFDLHEARHDYATSWIAHQTWRNAFGVPEYSGSIDAALALVNRLLPGAYWSIDHSDEGDPGEWYDVEIGQAFTQARTAPLAILAALLTTLITKEGTETK